MALTDRPNYDEGVTPITAPGTRVAAAPVDTFVRVAESPLEQLARSLKNLSPEVAQLGLTLQNSKDKQDYEAGTSTGQEAIVQGAKDWKDAISKNLVDPSRSPFYKAAVQEQFGRNAGAALTRAWELNAAQNIPLQTINFDPADTDKAFREFTDSWMRDNVDSADLTMDQHFRNGFDPVVAKARADTLDEATRQAAAKMQKMWGAGFFTEVMQAGDFASKSGLSPDESNQYYARLVMAQGNIGYNANPKNGPLIGQKAAEAIAAYAEATGDISRLDTMKYVKFGSGSLFDTQYGQAVYQATKSKIVEQLAQIHRLNADNREEAKAAGVETLSKDLMGALGAVTQDKAGSLDLSALKVRAVALLGKDGGQYVDDIQAAVSNTNTHDDPQIKRNLFVNIWTPDSGTPQTSAADITTALRNNQITFASAQTLLGDLAKQDSGTSVSYAKDPLLNKALGQLKDLYVLNQGDTEEQRVHLWQAEHQLTSDYIDWSEHGAGKGLQGKERDTAALKFLQEKSEEELHRIGSSTQVKTLDKQPARVAPGAPGHVDWNKAPAASPSSIKMVHNELWKFQNHYQNALAPEAISVLHAAGVDPTNLKEVQDFLSAQEKIQPALVRNPWVAPTPTVVKPE